MKLVKPLSFTQPCGKTWSVPIGAINDGASIPAFLWRVVGPPLTGQYRDAAVVHDYYCSVRTEPPAAVHLMFYDAMIASGVPKWKACQLYYGVKVGGPSWDELTMANTRLALEGFAGAAPSGGTAAPVAFDNRVTGILPTRTSPQSMTSAMSSDQLTIARDAAAEAEFKRTAAAWGQTGADPGVIDQLADQTSLRIERIALASVYEPISREERYRDQAGAAAASPIMSAPTASAYAAPSVTNVPR